MSACFRHSYIHSLIVVLHHAFLGTSCRSKATFTLARHFNSPLDAHCYYSQSVSERKKLPKKLKLHSHSSSTQTDSDMSSVINQMVSLVTALPEEQQYDTVNKVMQVLAARLHPTATVPDDFIALCLRAMERLKKFGRYNVVYGLVRALGTMREDGSDSRLPVLRMPMGMLEYIISFFQSESINKVNYYCKAWTRVNKLDTTYDQLQVLKRKFSEERYLQGGFYYVL